MDDLKASGQQAPQRFWRSCLPILEEWLLKLQQPADGVLAAEHMSHTFLLNAGEEVPDAELRQVPSSGELQRAVKRMHAGTARGLDNIPMSLIKLLGPEMREKMVDLLRRCWWRHCSSGLETQQGVAFVQGVR